MAVSNYISNHGYGNQSAGGGFDFEPAYDSEYNRSHDIAVGYNSNARAGLYADFGSADSSWTQAQIYTVSFGILDAMPFPEIYYPYQNGTSLDWKGVDSWAHNNNHSYIVDGVLDDYNAGNSCNSSFTPNDTYNYLMGYINSWQSSILYAVDQKCN